MVRNENNVMISKDEYRRLTQEAITKCSETDPDMPVKIILLLHAVRNEIVAYLGFLLFENNEEEQ